jgi:hypothetical protein
MITDPAKYTYQSIDELLLLCRSESDESVCRRLDEILGYIMNSYDDESVCRIMTSILREKTISDAVRFGLFHEISKNFAAFHEKYSQRILESDSHRGGTRIESYDREENNDK